MQVTILVVEGTPVPVLFDLSHFYFYMNLFAYALPNRTQLYTMSKNDSSSSTGKHTWVASGPVTIANKQPKISTAEAHIKKEDSSEMDVDHSEDSSDYNYFWHAQYITVSCWGVVTYVILLLF